MLYFNIIFCSLFNFTAGARIQSIPGEQQLLSLLPVPSMNNHYITVEQETLIVWHSHWNSYSEWALQKLCPEPTYQTISLSRPVQMLSQPCRLLSFKLILKSNGEQNVLTVHEYVFNFFTGTLSSEDNLQISRGILGRRSSCLHSASPQNRLENDVLKDRNNMFTPWYSCALCLSPLPYSSSSLSSSFPNIFLLSLDSLSMLTSLCSSPISIFQVRFILSKYEILHGKH